MLLSTRMYYGKAGRCSQARWGFWLLLLFFIQSVCCFGATSSQKVLILYSFGRDYTPFDDMSREFIAHLRAIAPQPVEIVEASLQMARFDGQEKELPLADFLGAIYGQESPDLVVAVGSPAMMFCHRHRGKLFSGTPVLILGADKRRIPAAINDDLVTSVSIDLDVPGMADNIRTLLPNVRQIYVVNGTAPIDRFWDSETKSVWPSRLPGVEIQWIGDQPFKQVLEAVEQAGPDSAIFYGLMSRDGDGLLHEGQEALQTIARHAKAPIFGGAREQLGQGIVGGSLMPLGEVGPRAAAVALRLLGGELPATIDTPPVEMGPPEYDARELDRWNIPRSRLPAGSQLRFRQPSLWESHRTLVLTVLAVGITETLFIILLVSARRQVKETSATLQLAADAANVGFWMRDPQKDEIQTSAKWREIFGLPANGRISLENIFSRIHAEDELAVRKLVQAASVPGERYEIEHRIQHPTKGVRWIATMGKTEATGERSAPRSRGLSIDITARKQMEAEVARQRSDMEHLSRVASLGELSGALAHELNQPLGSILANAQTARRLLQQPTPDSQEFLEIIEDIISEDTRAGEVIKRLKALLQRGETDRQSIDVSSCVSDVLHVMRGELMARGVQVSQQGDEVLPRALADRVQLQQILLNLIANACDAMDAFPPEKRTLTLRTATSGSTLELAVEDSGPGYNGDPEELFRSFHTTKKNGLGLGLSICRSIASAHDGKLWAERKPDGGMVFRLTLPVATQS